MYLIIYDITRNNISPRSVIIAASFLCALKQLSAWKRLNLMFVNILTPRIQWWVCRPIRGRPEKQWPIRKQEEIPPISGRSFVYFTSYLCASYQMRWYSNWELFFSWLHLLGSRRRRYEVSSNKSPSRNNNQNIYRLVQIKNYFVLLG